MKYYIFPFSSDAHAISALESSGRFEYKISSQNTTNAFAKLCAGDILVGYCIGTQQGVSYILKIKEVLASDQVEAEKIFEIGNVQIVNLKYSTLPPNIVYEIDEDSYHELLNDFFSVMLPARDEDNDIVSVPEESPLPLPDKPKNLIYFGAPGTGKSHKLKNDSEIFCNKIERVTFYPNYSYAQFVGSYKPVMRFNESKSEDEITYSYVPGPFIRQWIRAQNTKSPVLLIIEELNRANAPAVFGDMFQLLDRKNGESEYSIATSEDLRKYLESLLPDANNKSERKDLADWEKLPQGVTVTSLKIPENLYIWTTMNSADQGVFPLDTAFKRRWDYEYIGIDDNEKDIVDCTVKCDSKVYSWNSLRKAINDKLSKEHNVNEDKLIGPFFVAKELLDGGNNSLKAFNSKVLMYLFEDAARHCRSAFFCGDGKECKQENLKTYSAICDAFTKYGALIFGEQTEQNAIKQQAKNTNDTTEQEGKEE